MKKLLLLLALAGLAVSQPLPARPGGGHSSSPHSSHSSSSSSFSHSGSSWSTHDSSSGASGSAHPMSSLEALILFIIIVAIIIIVIRSQAGARSVVTAPPAQYRAQRQQSIAEQIAALKQLDANFSAVVFLDFAHSLYCKFYEYSTKPEFSYLSPFLSTELQGHFQRSQPWTVSEIVVNSLRWLEVGTSGSDSDTITVEIDANYTLDLQGRRSRYAVVERWQFYRSKGLLSAEPEKMQSVSCPQCGGPAHFTDAGVCGYCGASVQKGGAQWCLGKRVVVGTGAVPAVEGLAAYAEEQGTQAVTVKQADLIEQMNRGQQRYGIAEWQQFWAPFENDVVRNYFAAIYGHWSRRDWQAARHLLSDRLYETNAFWQKMYVERGWFNRLDNLCIEQIVLAKIDSDKFYEAITVRIFAACNDYTEDAGGKIVGGSKTSLRRFSEYWTFVRRSGAQRHDKPYSLSQCPSCGAPADNMGQSGECGYCGSKISNGQFSWVLFLIEQDEVYCG
ncbi:TIM44-like domain-containing protein [Methylomonas koyamae]|uniref:TIM44-like domain-containing protein n=1 Tax=Methylomonas koyamae TaxID=702114 RepID=UPI000BC30BF7|nr:TIM44-like domain-containing protein [Methylomonas koyamae]ATG92471.1 hypothetical protein MKLM6_4307 [Methylomonas koyamae]